MPTPVFNGSTSLRNAAGELVELTVSSAIKNRTIDESFMELLFSRVTSLYKLDQIETGITKKELGDLPSESKILICGLGAIWIGIGTSFAISYIQRKKNSIKY